MKTHPPLTPLRFKRLFEAGPTAIAISPLPDGRFVEVNEAFLALHGYSRREIIGSTSAELKLWNDEGWWDQILALVQRLGRARNFVYECRRKSGQVGRALASVDMIELDRESFPISRTRIPSANAGRPRRRCARARPGLTPTRTIWGQA